MPVTRSNYKSYLTGKHENAIRAKFELDYVKASGNIGRKENTFVYAIYQLASSSLSTSDKKRGINRLIDQEHLAGRTLRVAEMAFIEKADAFLGSVRESTGLKATDIKLHHWVHSQTRSNYRSYLTGKHQNAMRSKFEIDYIEASGNIKGENTFIHAVYQMASSSLSASDKSRGISLLVDQERRSLEDAEIEFIDKASAFVGDVQESTSLKQKDAKLSQWVNTLVVIEPAQKKRTWYERPLKIAIVASVTMACLFLGNGVKPESVITVQTPSLDKKNVKVSQVVALESPVYHAAASTGAFAPRVIAVSSSAQASSNQPTILTNSQSPALSSGNPALNGSQPAPAVKAANGPTAVKASDLSITGLDFGIMEDGPSKTTAPTLTTGGLGGFLTPGTKQSVGNERAYSATVAKFGAQSLSVFLGNSRFSSLQINSADLAINYSNTNYLTSDYYGAVRTDENILGGKSLAAGLFIDQQTPIKRLDILASASYLPSVTTFNVAGPNVTQLVGGGGLGSFLSSVPSTVSATNIAHSVNFGIGGDYKLTENSSIFGSFAEVYGKSVESAGYEFKRGVDLFGLRGDYTSGSDPTVSAYVAGETFMGKVSYSPGTSELSGFGEYALWGTVIPSFETSEPLERALRAPVGTVFGSDETSGYRKPASVDLEPKHRFAVGVSGSISDDLSAGNMQDYYGDIAWKLKISRRFEIGGDVFTEKETGINGASMQNSGVGGIIEYNFGRVKASVGGGVTEHGGFVEGMLRF